MRIRVGLILGIAAFLALGALGTAFSQEPQGEANVQWVWGEVVSVNQQSNELSLSFLDFETDQEKQIAITTDTNTTFENAQSLSDIKPKDTVGIDYIVSADGKNIAKNIGLEKPEAPATGTGEAATPMEPESSIPAQE